MLDSSHMMIIRGKSWTSLNHHFFLRESILIGKLCENFVWRSCSSCSKMIRMVFATRFLMRLKMEIWLLWILMLCFQSRWEIRIMSYSFSCVHSHYMRVLLKKISSLWDISLGLCHDLNSSLRNLIARRSTRSWIRSSIVYLMNWWSQNVLPTYLF